MATVREESRYRITALEAQKSVSERKNGHPDHLNTPRLIADDQQRTVWRYRQGLLGMMRFIRGSLILFGSYLAAWTVVYLAVMAGDTRYFFEYLVLAWTDPGEIPATINIFALIITAITAGITWFVRSRKKLKKSSQGT